MLFCYQPRRLPSCLGWPNLPLIPPRRNHEEIAMLRSLALVAAGMIGLGSTEPARADALVRVTQLTVEPAQITLRHADDRQQLIITGKLPDGSARDLTRDVQFGSSNPGVAVVSSRGVVAATGAGQANIHVVGAGLAAIVPVTVKGIA